MMERACYAEQPSERYSPPPLASGGFSHTFSLFEGHSQHSLQPVQPSAEKPEVPIGPPGGKFDAGRSSTLVDGFRFPPAEATAVIAALTLIDSVRRQPSIPSGLIGPLRRFLSGRLGSPGAGL
jgi:hypothetical protein